MLMSATRESVCESTSKKLAAALAKLPQLRAVIGLDGFVDEIIAVVERRTDFQNFDRVPNISRLAEKISAAAGRSSNYELVVQRMKLGGNGPIMANALASIGVAVTYIGNLGFPVLHPVFEEFSKRASVISIAEPGHTDALEFDDGKLMLGKITALNDVTWQTLLTRIGLTKIQQLVAAAALIGTVNWTMIPFMNDLWLHLREDVFKSLPPLPGRLRRKLFVDLADPEKRTHEDISVAMNLLTAFQPHVDVILGLNLKESCSILEVLGLPCPSDAEAAIEQTAAAIRQKLGLACVVIHPRGGAAAATAGESASFAGPFVRQPKISTGAGDHFNAGFCIGRVLDFSVAESLCTGVGVSGYYVRNAASPTGSQLAQFIAQLPPPQ
jgi:sugar/nucleoside kinase (ribokinase family)